MKSKAWIVAAVLALLMGALAARPLMVGAPALRAETAQDAFDALRAFDRLARILGDEAPHPVDSAANDAVRERLFAEMRAVGLQPHTSDDLACNSSPFMPAVSCARVVNVWATIGPAEGRHVMAVAHYDSAIAGAGATDAGIGVATLLETAERLRGQPLTRPVTFLFTDGEEAGLIGARAFMARNPLAAEVGAIVNFEARGTEGPAIMFETSKPNAEAIAHFARSARRPVANSLTTDFYKMIPNSTDVAVFEERPYTILNFAVIGNETRYHSPGDDLAAFSLASLQHMGDQGAAVVESLAAGAPVAASGERIYTDILGRHLVVLPAMVGFVLLGLLLLLFAWYGWRRAGLGRAGLTLLAALAGAAALTWLGQGAVGLVRGGDFFRAYPVAVGIALQLSALAAALPALLWLGGRLAAVQLRTAYWFYVLALGAVLTLIAPGAAILFLIPPLPLAIGLLAVRWVPGAERVGAALSALILFLLFAPLLELVEVLLFHRSAWMFAPLAALILLPVLIELKALLLEVP
ncbi:MAG: M20/M25/M40 family metallo-hydrolase, partial [Allosphingosinicella sp.]|uniref:M20/M25/M40 family metallo-hydrolase n=1 Tax=Allosphingosinicella sp. TaxID=2823234 RepID=UPI00394E8BF3